MHDGAQKRRLGAAKASAGRKNMKKRGFQLSGKNYPQCCRSGTRCLLSTMHFSAAGIPFVKARPVLAKSACPGCDADVPWRPHLVGLCHDCLRVLRPSVPAPIACAIGEPPLHTCTWWLQNVTPARHRLAGFPTHHGMPMPSPPGPVFLAPLGKDTPRYGMMSQRVGLPVSAPTSAAATSGAQAGLEEAALQQAGIQRAAQPSALRLVLNEDGELVPVGPVDMPSEPSDLSSLPSSFYLKGGTMQFAAAAAAVAAAAATVVAAAAATATDSAMMGLGELEADLNASFKDSTHTWQPDQDAILLQLVNENGPRNWSLIADKIPGKVGKQCRERYFHLSSDL